MKTVKEVSKLSGVSVRTLQYYDKIGLLPPTERTEAGYRLYDHGALERLQQILLFRELEFPLKEIKTILSSPNFDRNKALEQQIEYLTLKKKHLENLILFARRIKLLEVKEMDFTAFDTQKLDEYARRAKEMWEQTPEYRQFEEKSRDRTPEERETIERGLMDLFTEFGALRGSDPGAEEAQAVVEKLKAYITEHFYTCSDEILYGLGRMYNGGGEMTENIDRFGGEGTAAFASAAIQKYCGH